MKNIDKIALGKRLWRYFMRSGYSVEVTADREGGGSRRCKVRVRRVSPWSGNDFQSASELVDWTAANSNASFDNTAKSFADWWCGGIAGYGARSRECYDNFVSAGSLEELDLKLASRGF